jgi:hypothetical protein
MNAGLKLAAALILMGTAAPTAELRKETVQAFDEYVRKTEARLDARVASGDFLWVDDSKQTLDPVRNGQVAIQPRIKGGEMEVPHGLIHDWIGAVFIPGTTLDRVLASVQDYDRNKYTHKPEVIDSKLLARDGNDFRIFLKVRKKKVITVVLNTEHRVHYAPVDKTRWQSRSYSTRIAEVDNAGEPDERELPQGEDHGFLWRLYSYWRFEERDGGVYVECEALSLTRDVPTGLGWVVTPVIRTLPRESLESTLRGTRNAVLAGRR